MKIRTAAAAAILAIALVGFALFAFIRMGDEAVVPGAELAFEKATESPVSEEAFRFEFADTAEERAQGLSGRADVPSGYGLLFVFPEKGMHGFWMKDMLVPIDMIWLADDGTVLSVDESVSPATYPASFHPPLPVSLVLETRAGEARARGWTTGARIPLPPMP